ncbi:MAG TPA: hypothetical protein VF198_00345 [Vicinamibacterales bacterium]
MDTALQVNTRRQDAPLHVIANRQPAPAQSLNATAAFRLSEAGRKTSLLMGGNGREHQELTVEVPVTRLHLVCVDAHGVARLRLRPRFELDDQQRILRIDALPVYDAPPTVETLFLDAARNHELESRWHAQQRAARASRQERAEEWRRQVAEEFLADASRRALVHPAPTPRRCTITTERGRLEFDARRDRGIAREVPLEAFRRYHADLRERRARGLAEREAQTLVHGERTRLVHEWITAHGTPDQRERLAAGLLPLEEGIDAMAADAFQALARFREYQVHGPGPAQLQAHLRQFPDYADALVTRSDLRVVNRALPAATPRQWAFLRQVQAAVPDATVLLRERCLIWTRDPRAPKLRHVTVLAIKKVGPITLRRELWVPDDAAPEPGSTGGTSMPA